MAKRKLSKAKLAALETDMLAALVEVAAKHGVEIKHLALWASDSAPHIDVYGNLNISILPKP